MKGLNERDETKDVVSLQDIPNTAERAHENAASWVLIISLQILYQFST